MSKFVAVRIGKCRLRNADGAVVDYRENAQVGRLPLEGGWKVGDTLYVEPSDPTKYATVDIVVVQVPSTKVITIEWWPDIGKWKRIGGGYSSPVNRYRTRGVRHRTERCCQVINIE